MTERRGLVYQGYLSPHVASIIEMRKRGLPKTTIGRLLYVAGVRPSGHGCRDRDIQALSKMVGHVLRSEGIEPRTRVVQDWQTWTPEMQEAEFVAGYAR